MIKKILVIDIMCMFLLAGIASANSIANNIKINKTSGLSNVGLLNDPNDLAQITKNASEYYQKDARWHNWSDHGMECDNYWYPTGNDRIYYNIDLPQNITNPIILGAEFKADGVPWNGGPDLEAYDSSNETWVKIQQGMGKPSTLIWKWYVISKDCINRSGGLKFCILCAGGCHTWLDSVGVQFELILNPNLDCNGILNWVDAKPGSTVTGNFSVKNIGDPGSELNWRVTEWPSWGTWTFDPQSGGGLKPEDGEVVVQVVVVAPNQQNYQFNGHIKVVDTDNFNDYAIIPVSLTTPLNKPSSQQNIQGSNPQSNPQVNPSLNQQKIIQQNNQLLQNLIYNLIKCHQMIIFIGGVDENERKNISMDHYFNDGYR